MITNSFTAASMASAFTGQLPSQLEPKGIGWGGCYFKKTEDEKKIWNNKFIFNNLDKDWKIITYADEKNKVWLTNNLCNPMGHLEQKVHVNYKNEIQLLDKIQKNNNTKEFYWIKYDHYHDNHGPKAIKRFLEILNNINFSEKDSFFWIFSDHGEWRHIDEFMKPPHSSIGWNVVINNLSNIEDNREICHITDFYHYVMALTKGATPKFMDEFYYCEDGRARISLYSTTTFSVLTKTSESIITQMSFYNNKARVYDYDYKAGIIKNINNVDFNNIKSGEFFVLKEKLIQF